MATHIKHLNGEIYFVTFTCYKWLPLIEASESYSSFYNFFNELKNIQVPLLGYVIMPNHFHCLLYVPENSPKTLDRIIAGGKRFLAYDIIKNLKSLNKINLIERLELGVQFIERKKGKKHQVFRLSYDAKDCKSKQQIEHYLDYMHHNPVKGKWRLAEDFARYPYSSAAYYENGLDNIYLTHYLNNFDSGSLNPQSPLRRDSEG